MPGGEGRDRRRDVEAGDDPTIAPRRASEMRRRIVERAVGGAGVVVDRRGAEEIGVGLVRGEAAQVLRQLAQQVGATPRVAAVEGDIRVRGLVKMIVVQAVDDR